MKKTSFHLLIVFVLCLQLDASWKTTRNGNITIISNASTSRTTQIVREIELFQTGVQTFFSGKLEKSSYPTTVILCKNKKTFYKIAREGIKQKGSQAYFQRTPNCDLIVMTASAKRSYLKSVVFHEMTHRLTERMMRLPLWLDEGYAQIFEEFEVKPTKLTFGKANENAARSLANAGVMPLEKLFAARHHSKEYNHRKLAHSFYGTSWAFTHMCVFSHKKNFRKPFFDFVDAIALGKPIEEQFTKHFGMSFDAMEKKIKRYVFTPSQYEYHEMDAPGEITTKTIKFREATRDEINLYTGMAMAASKKQQAARNRLVSILYSFDEPQTETSPDSERVRADVMAALCTVEYLDNNMDFAKEYAEKAVQLGTISPWVNQYYIHCKLNKAQENFGVLTRSDLNEILKILHKQIRLGIDNEAMHELHARAWKLSDDKPKISHLNALIHAALKFPDNFTISSITSKTLEEAGKIKDAITILENFTVTTDQESLKEDARERIARLKEIAEMS